MLSDSVTRGDGGCFLDDSSLKSRSGGLTVAVIYFHHKHSVQCFLYIHLGVMGRHSGVASAEVN